ncbi:ECF transporter S component [Alkaliphilus crotonatoxidans]
MKNKALSPKKMAIAGVLGALTVVLSVTPFLGFIPIGTISVTTMHIPIIIAAILAGPQVALFVGLIFGISSFIRATPGFFSDPLVSILPRIFIGLTAYYSYKLTKSPVVAAIIGTATNTIGVLTMVYLRGYLPLAVVTATASINGTAEIIISSIIVYAIIKVLQKNKAIKSIC